MKISPVDPEIIGPKQSLKY